MTEKELFEIEVQMDLDEEEFPNLSDEDLEKTLRAVIDDSDANLKAAAEYFRLNHEQLESYAGRLEVDEGFSRVTANRLALARELKAYMPDISDALCRWFSRNSAILMDLKKKHGMTNEQFDVELLAYFRRNYGAESEVARDMDALLERVAV